jgi:hypothetical protein
MAKIRASTNTVVRSDSDNIIVSLPDGYQIGDLLLIFAGKDDSVGGTLGITPGWTAGTDGVIGSGANSIRGNYFYKIAASTSETLPVITSTDSDTWVAVALAIYGHDAVTPIDIASAATTVLVGSPYAAPSVTTTTNNALLIRAIISDGSVAQMPVPGFVMLEVADGSAEAICVAYDLQFVAGATPTCNFFTQGQADESLTWTIAIRDGSGGAILPGVPNADCATLIRPFLGNNFSIAGDSIDTNANNFSQLAGTWQNPTLVYQVDASPLTFTDITTAATNATDGDVVPFPATEATGDYLAVRFSAQPRALRIDRLGSVQGVGGACAREYLATGGTWKSFLDIFDATSNFTSSLADHQIVSWSPPTDWTSQSLNGQSGFWMRFRVTTVYTTNPTISQIFVSTSIALQHFTLTGRTNAGFLPAYDSLNMGLSQSGNSMVGGAYSVPAAIDLSAAKILGTYLYDSPSDHLDVSPRDEGGLSVGLIDSTDKLKMWAIGARNSLDASPNKRNIYLIQTNQSTDTSFLTSSPTLADVRKFLFANNCKFGAVQASHTTMINVGTLKISGGGTTAPINFLDLIKVANGVPCPMIDEITNTAYVPIQFGGDRRVNVYISGATLGFPSHATEANKRTSFHCDPGVAGIIYDLRAGDVCRIETSKIFGGSPWQLTVPATASVSATFSSSGTVYDNAIVNWRYFALSSASFSNCTVFNLISGSLSGCSVIATKIVTGVVSNIVNCAFTSGGAGHAIEITTPGTYTFDRNAFTGYGANGTTDAAIYNNSGGAVTLNLQNYSDTTPTVRNGAGASTTVVPFPKVASVTGLIAGSNVQIFNVTTNTQISNAVEAGTSLSATYQEGAGFTSGDVVRVRAAKNGYLPYQTTAVAGSVGWSVLASQITDTVYAANGIDGSTVTEFSPDGANVQIDINDPDGITSWQRLYAWYINSLMSASGIADFFGGVIADDEVNYRIVNSVVNIKLDNVTAGPVMIIGARGYREDGATVIAATSGSIHLDPDKAYIANSASLSSGIASAVWDEPLTSATHNVPTSAGRRLRQLGTTLAADGALTGTPTTTNLPTNLTQATSNFYNDQTLRMTSGALTGQAVPILSYNGATKTITLSEALTSAPSAGDTFEIDSDHVHSIAQIQNGLAAQSDMTTVKNLIEADETHSGTQIKKLLKGTATELLVKNHSGTPLSSFQAVE